MNILVLGEGGLSLKSKGKGLSSFFCCKSIKIVVLNILFWSYEGKSASAVLSLPEPVETFSIHPSGQLPCGKISKFSHEFIFFEWFLGLSLFSSLDESFSDAFFFGRFLQRLSNLSLARFQDLQDSLLRDVL